MRSECGQAGGRSGCWSVGVGVAALVLGVAACGNAERSDVAAEPATPTVSPAGPMFGVCGGLTDDEVLAAFAVPAFATVTRNSVGCEWEVSGPSGPSVSFSWYRGSPIGRERMGSEMIGRPAEDIEIDGQRGFSAQAVNALGQPYLCENALQYGDDFIHFSVIYADSEPTADPCTVATTLLGLVAERAR